MKPLRPTLNIQGEEIVRETNSHLRKVGRQLRRKNKKASKADHDHIVGTFLAAITGKCFTKGETIRDLVARNCPNIYRMAEERGLVFTVDLPSNTYENLSAARVFYECTPMTRH